MNTLILNPHHSCVSIPLLGFAFSAVMILIHRVIVHMVGLTWFSLWSHEIFIQTCLFQSILISAFNIILGIFLKALGICIWYNHWNMLNYFEKNIFEFQVVYLRHLLKEVRASCHSWFDFLQLFLIIFHSLQISLPTFTRTHNQLLHSW